MLGSRTGKFGRNPIVALGAATHLICFLIVYINLPADAPLKKTNEKGLIDPRYVPYLEYTVFSLIQDPLLIKDPL